MEFGSDFHMLEYPRGEESLLRMIPEANLYASGRQTLLDLARARGWNRLWVPSYFCEETLDCLPRIGVELCYYPITPADDPADIIPGVPVESGDGLLVVNYFGLFDKRVLDDIGCEIVEDHTHNLIGSWALNSSADWCVASLRKTLPIADGGILWSPKRHKLPDAPESHDYAQIELSRRVKAMEMKRDYLAGNDVDKTEYLKIFSETEAAFDEMPISAMSETSLQVINDLNIREWYKIKHRNWNFLYDHLKENERFKILKPENVNDSPFSLTLLFDDNKIRDAVRKSLIEAAVYPAVLWNIERSDDISSKNFGDRILSIHCDGRYSLKDQQILLKKIKDSLIKTNGNN